MVLGNIQRKGRTVKIGEPAFSLPPMICGDDCASPGVVTLADVLDKATAVILDAATPLGDTAREATARPYIGKRRA
jgi:hypothetical protein